MVAGDRDQLAREPWVRLLRIADAELRLPSLARSVRLPRVEATCRLEFQTNSRRVAAPRCDGIPIRLES